MPFSTIENSDKRRIAIIAGSGSDIAIATAKSLSNLGYELVAISRETSKLLPELYSQQFTCDFLNKDELDSCLAEIRGSVPPWDVLLLAAGTLRPVGEFIGNDFDEWSNSIELNFTSQMRILNRLISVSNGTQESPSACILFSGGGVNKPVNGYSAYTIAKSALIKATEILDFELPSVKFSILGPGWVRTKIHQEVLDALHAPIDSRQETLRRLQENDFNSIDSVVDAIIWLISQPKEIVGGRNFSISSGDFYRPELPLLLQQNSDLFKLRRNEAT
jgi:NAD(P)-dependent dehydrogenase (short-subunit alcohol dehydrogenase family)